MEVVSAAVLTTLEVQGNTLRAATWGQGTPEIVMLHDGLGSISQWRSVPAAVADRTGNTVMAYERAGHGQSLPTPSGPWPTAWLQREAEVLQAVLEAVGAKRPWIVGHSDGGSAALLHAAQPTAQIRAVLALACHSWVEDICFESIVSMRENRLKIVAGLAKHHAEPDALFEAWSGVWVSDDFNSWDIRPEIAAITVPTLIAQGKDDAYATESHAHLTAAAIGPNADSLIVNGVGHIMHHDDAEAVVDLICRFVGS